MLLNFPRTDIQHHLLKRLSSSHGIAVVRWLKFRGLFTSGEFLEFVLVSIDVYASFLRQLSHSLDYCVLWGVLKSSIVSPPTLSSFYKIVLPVLVLCVSV